MFSEWLIYMISLSSLWYAQDLCVAGMGEVSFQFPVGKSIT